MSEIIQNEAFTIPDFGIILRWDRRREDEIARFRFDAADFLSMHERRDNDAHLLPPYDYLEIESQYSTSLDFEDHVGAGHLITIENWHSNICYLSIALETDDRFMADNGEQGYSTSEVLEIALGHLKDFVGRLAEDYGFDEDM